jgi:hypothetical protein
MTVTALQTFRMTGVDVILGKVDESPFSGEKPGRKFHPIIETASIQFEPGMRAEDLLPGYWTLCDCESEPPEHPRLSAQGDGRYRLDTFDFEPSDLPLEITGLIRIER